MRTGNSLALPGGRNRGFTLIELVFVVLILATMVGMAAPIFQKSYRRASWEAASGRLADLMAYARERAVMERAPYRVDFDGSDGSYWLSAGGPEGFSRMDDRWGRTRRVPPDVVLTADVPAVTFYPDGTASEGSIKLAAGEKDVCQLRVEPILGRVIVDETPAQ